MASTTDTATTRDGIRILTRHWSAETPKAAVLFVHGLGEHSARYGHVGDQFAAAGYECFGWDHRGFGASGGERAWVDDWSRFHDDVEDRLGAVRSAVPGRPVVLYGHSMGGLIALGYCVSGRPLPDLLVLSAPGIDDNLGAWKRVAAPLLARIAPHLMISNGPRPDMLSKVPDRQREARGDPLMLDRSTVKFGALGFAEQVRVRGAASRLSIPTLVIQGLADRIVPARATEPLGAIPGVTRRTYEDVRHELHNEAEGPAIMADVIAWMDGQLARPAR
ncbi:MAG: lysophospholipase [Chloroflexi bacterium]|nr:lysophospholipase [Chloroflexota bacterium]